jgi:hypothetical protein
LTQISLAYRNPTYIADSIFPILPVMKQSDIITKYDQSHWFRDGAQIRAPGTKSQGGGYTVDTSQHYFCPRYSFRKEVYDESRDNADSVFNLDREATEFCADKLQMRREVAFANANFVTGQWTGGTTDPAGGTQFTQWDDYANSNPLVDLASYQDGIEGAIAVQANTLVMGKQVWLKLKWHPDFIDSIKYTQRGQLDLPLFTSLVEFERVLVGRGIYTTTKEGTAESAVTYSRIWGKSALMLYVPARPSLMTPAAGYTFVWQRVPSAIQYMKRFRDEERETDIVECSSYFTQVQTAARAGCFLQTVVS